MVEVFGIELIIKMAAIGIIFYFFALAPVWIPGVQAYRYRNHLTKPVFFVFTVACVTYGLLMFIIVAVAIPAEAYAMFIAPQLEAACKPYGGLFVTIIDFLVTYFGLILVPIQIVLTVIITNKLIKKWGGVCASLFG